MHLTTLFCPDGRTSHLFTNLDLQKQLGERGDAWRKMWFVVKDHVLYTYKAPADAIAAESQPLLGYDFDLDVEVR